MLLLFLARETSEKKKRAFCVKSKQIAEHRTALCSCQRRQTLCAVDVDVRFGDDVGNDVTASRRLVDDTVPIKQCAILHDPGRTGTEKLPHPTRLVFGVSVLGLQREYLEQFRTRLQKRAMQE